MNVTYIIVDKSKFQPKPGTKTIVVVGDSARVETTAKSELVCNFCFESEVQADIYAKKKWGEDYEDYVIIIPLIIKSTFDLDIEANRGK